MGISIGDQEARGGHRLNGASDLFDARQQVVEALEQARREQTLGDDDVDALEGGQACKEIEIRRPQTMAVGSPIRNGDHDLSIRRRKGRLHQEAAEAVLVNEARTCEPRFVCPKRCDQKACLPKQAIGAPVHSSAGLELAHHQALEGVECAMLPMERVVEREDRANQRGSYPKRRVEALFDCIARCRVAQNLALVSGDEERRVNRLARKPIVERISRHQVGQGERAARTTVDRHPSAQREGFQRPPQLRRCGAGGDDNHTASRGVEIVMQAQLSNRCLKASQAGRTVKPRLSRRYHFNSGGTSARPSSSRTRASIIIAAAAADEASQADRRLVSTTACRRRPAA